MMLRFLAMLIQLGVWIFFISCWMQAIKRPELRQYADRVLLLVGATGIPFWLLLVDSISWLVCRKPIQTVTTFWQEFKEFREWRKRAGGGDQ